MVLVGGGAAKTEAPCFETSGIFVCYENDESVFYATPENEVAYSVQTIHDGDKFYTIYHSEPRTHYKTGDAVKSGVHQGPYAFTMPPHDFRLWGPEDDPASLMASTSVGGAANPIAISGLPGDPYFYVFFLGVNDDEQTRDRARSHWRHYLLEARTRDFVSFDLMTDAGWAPFSPDVRPAPVRDTAGAIIRSNSARVLGHTQGLIGSISFVNGRYYFFYFDYGPEGDQVNLYLRTSADLRHDRWSSEKRVSPAIGLGMVRVAKAWNLDRWAVMYGCYVGKIQDICVQYTRNLNVYGPGGLSDLHLTSSEFALGLARDGRARSYAQPYWLTDRWGNLDSPDSNGGMEFYWTDMTRSQCRARPYPFCPVYGGAVRRGRWSVHSSANNAGQ
jgi:hypothetical protein